MNVFFRNWWDAINDPRGYGSRPADFAFWLSIVLGQIAALLLGGLGGTFVQGLLHTKGTLANIAVLVGVPLASLLVGYGLQYGTAVATDKASGQSDLAYKVVLSLLNIFLVFAAGFAIYSYFAQNIQVSSKIAIGALVLSIALKLGSLLLVGVIIPILKALPVLLFGEGFRRWARAREERRKAKVR